MVNKITKKVTKKVNNQITNKNTKKNTKNIAVKKKSQKTTTIISVFIVLVILSFVFLIFNSGEKSRTSTEELAQCLVDKGYVMGGASWCSHCKAQKELFEGAFESIIIPQKGYVDCEANEQSTNWCIENEIKGYPTWVTPEGDLLEGTQQLNTLEKISGC